MTTENDIVLIHFEDRPLTFARVESILPDSKPDWYHVKLLMLQVPLQVVTWILRNAYINGTTFTMNGKEMRIEKVVSPEAPEMPEAQPDTEASLVPPPAKVISLADLKDRSS